MAKFAAPALIALFVSAIHIQTLIAQPVDRSRILAPGNPPLTQAMVNKSLDLAEWALRMTLSREERSQVQEFFTESWKRGEKNGVIEAVEMYDMISQIPAASKESAREKLRDLMLQNLNRDPNDRMNQIFLSAHNRARNLATGSATLPSVPQPGSQAISWDFSEAGTLTETQARSVLGSAARPVEADQTRPLTFAAAMERVRKFVNGFVSADAVSAFHSSTEGRTADSAAAVAAGAIVAEMPLLAVTALLRAHELEPANATHLANLAAVLTFIERPEEALSIISSPQVMNGTVASTLEIGGQAAVFNIRGHALLQLGRAAEAEVALRKATELYPNFAEAKANLAFALWQQEDPKKKEEGVRIIGGVWRIRPGKTMFDVVERPHITGGPDEEIAVDIFGDSTGNRRLDTSRGKRLYLPDLKIPTTLEASVSMYPKYAALKTKTEDLLLAYGQGQLNPGDANKEDEAVVKRSIETYGRLSPEALLARKEKLEAIKEALELTNVQQQSAVRPHWEKLKQVFRENYSNVQTPVLTSIPMTGTAEVGPAGVELYKRLRELDRNPNYGLLACTAARSAHKRWLIGINAYDQAAREYLKAAYSYMTGVAANVHDPIEHRELEIAIREHIYTEWRNLIHYANGFHHFAVLATGPNGWCSSAGGPGDDLGDLRADAADRCPDFLKGNNKATLDFVIAKLSFNCETIGLEIGVGLSGPGGIGVPKWIQAFIEIEAKFKDGRISKFRGMTIVTGVKTGAGDSLRAKLSGKVGAYVKVGRDGEIYDGGIKTGGSATTNTGPIAIKASAGTEISFAPAFRALDSAIERLIQ